VKIYGAGISGLLAGCHFQRAEIFEAGSEDQTQHKAVLRFRSSSVGDSVGIEFRKVRVHKGIWFGGKSVSPSIQLANWYSRKVVGRLADRSIWNLEASDRYIAPEDFVGLLAERCAGRIVWDHKIDREQVLAEPGPAISTLPMRTMLQFLADDLDQDFIRAAPEFSFAQISVRRWRVDGADVFQSIYFPSLETNLYRASMTGDLLIAEYVGEVDDYDFFGAFGLSERHCAKIETTSQRYGKIAKIDDAWRKNFMFQATSKHQIYSLGRFGTWRNILLDDVLHDIQVIKKLMNTSSYGLASKLAK
jgi:hypothetical protein